jgi:nucleoside-diphosphate-sugar epimerase
VKKNCRYDVSLNVNVMGVKHLYQFAKQCANLKMFMHVSTGPSVCSVPTW